MKFPFVSRDRLEEVQDRLRASEEERHLLADRLALLRGEPPIFSKLEATTMASAEPVAEPIHVVTREAAAPPKEKPKKLAGSVSFDQVLAAADSAARAGTVGSTRTY